MRGRLAPSCTGGPMVRTFVRSGFSPCAQIVAAIVLAGCVGDIGAAPPRLGTVAPDSPMAGNAGTNVGGSGPPAVTQKDPKFVPQPASMRRLTQSQYWNTIDDLFGPGAPRNLLDTELPEDGFFSIYAATKPTSPMGVEQYEKSALAISSWAFSDAARRTALAGCQGAMDASCAQAFITRFGRLVFRRPLTTTEVARYVPLFNTGADFWDGMQLIVGALLQSPNFIYRAELGSPTTNKDLLLMDGFDMASRLSYLVWGGPPDAALLDLAQKGQLTTADAVTAQAVRMLSSPKARRGLRDYFQDALRMTDM